MNFRLLIFQFKESTYIYSRAVSSTRTSLLNIYLHLNKSGSTFKAIIVNFILESNTRISTTNLFRLR